MKKVLLFSMMAAFSVIACQKETELVPVTEPESEVVLTTITASAGKAETKAYVDELQVKWSKNDVIAVADEDGTIVDFELQGEGGTASGTFSGNLGGKALGTYAVYPNTTNSAVSGTTATVDYLASWDYGKSEVPMYGINNGSGAYTFNNIGGAILISYTNVPATAKNFRITETHIGAAAKPITGSVAISDLDSTPAYDLSGLDGQTVTINNVVPDGEGNVSFVIPVPAGEGYIFRFELLNVGFSVIPGTQKIASNQTITANKIKRFPAIAVPGSTPDVKTLTFDFSAPAKSGWDGKQSAGNVTYTLDEVNYTFTVTETGNGISQNASYLMMNSYNALGFPIITNYRLSKVTLHTSNSASTSVQVGIVSNTSSYPYVDDARSAKTLSSQGADFSFDLTASYKDKRYYLYVANNKNSQITSLTLTYEESSRVFTPTALTMSSISVTAKTASSLTFGWDAVAGAAGYQVSTDNGAHYSSTQAARSYTWSELSSFTDNTIYIKAIGDGADFVDSSAGTKTGKTTLTVPTSVTWTEGTKTVSWTDANTGAGTYGSVYKYVYTLDNGENSSDASSRTTAILSITETKTCKVKAVCLTDATLSSDWTSGTSCTIGGATETDIYTSGFESSESFTAGTTYNSTVTSGPSGKQWTTYYGTPSTNDAIVDSQSMQMRVYNGQSSSPYTMMTFNLSKVTEIKFKAKSANTTDIKGVKIYYSTDSGSSWSLAKTHSFSGTTTEDVSYTFASTQATVRFKLELDIKSGITSTRKCWIDSVVVRGFE